MLHLDIPESVAAGLRLPGAEIELRLFLALALALYAQEILFFGKAVELAGISRYRFGDVLSERGIPRHYSDGDLCLI